MTVRVKVAFANAEEVRQTFLKLGEGAVMATARGLYRAANEIMTDSKQHYVPFRFGTLRSSGYVALPKVDKTKVVQHLGYGGAASAYALVQHERLDYKHTRGQAKYLELPAIRHAPEISGLVTTELREALKRSAKKGRV